MSVCWPAVKNVCRRQPAISETGASDLQSSTVTREHDSHAATAEPAKCVKLTCRTHASRADSIVIANHAWFSSFGFCESHADSRRRFSTPTFAILPGQV